MGLSAATADRQGSVPGYRGYLEGQPKSGRLGYKKNEDPAVDNLVREIGSRIKELREERGWSALELAVKVGVSQGAIYQWERNEFPLGRTSQLAGVFGVDARYLLTGNESVEQRLARIEQLLRMPGVGEAGQGSGSQR